MTEQVIERQERPCYQAVGRIEGLRAWNGTSPTCEAINVWGSVTSRIISSSKHNPCSVDRVKLIVASQYPICDGTEFFKFVQHIPVAEKGCQVHMAHARPLELSFKECPRTFGTCFFVDVPTPNACCWVREDQKGDNIGHDGRGKTHHSHRVWFGIM